MPPAGDRSRRAAGRHPAAAYALRRVTPCSFRQAVNASIDRFVAGQLAAVGGSTATGNQRPARATYAEGHAKLSPRGDDLLPRRSSAITRPMHRARSRVRVEDLRPGAVMGDPARWSLVVLPGDGPAAALWISSPVRGRGCPSARRPAAALGFNASARAIATRCCSPPESSGGRCVACGPRGQRPPARFSSIRSVLSPAVHESASFASMFYPSGNLKVRDSAVELLELQNPGDRGEARSEYRCAHLVEPLQPAGDRTRLAQLWTGQKIRAPSSWSIVVLSRSRLAPTDAATIGTAAGRIVRSTSLPDALLNAGSR